ncbi:response regulator transcription factor [Paenibacillus whitsoniae]|uniref:Response regulator n=1 Tax=Paenibacillus whitsoniae TaxID=2496558 RepID=A0A3S0BKR0_9BACL|nr:response regulator [Paenibacillus whitsoniae]RTE08766.1 response regulator [Paenibacillus whitsoniae]
MTQLLLVDDEPVILKSMIANDWSGIGVEQVFQAASGLEAAELLKHTPIDIVVTDIRMPGMDGLQLCKHIQEHYPHTKCILLSGYGEFEYAQQAIRYGTVNYLLKPIKDEELLAEVARVRTVIRQEWEEIGSLEQARQTLHVNLPLLKSNLLNDLLTGVNTPANGLNEKIYEYGLPFMTGSNCAVMMIRLEEGFGRTPHDALLYEFAVHNIACEILHADYDTWACKDAFGYMIFLLKGKWKENETTVEKEKILDKTALDLQLKVKGYLKGGLSVLISEYGEFPEGVVELYHKALNEFRKVPRSEQGVIIKALEPRAQSKSLSALYSPPGFIQLLEAGRFQDAKSKLNHVLEEMQAKQLDTEEHTMEVAYTLMNAFLYTAHLQNKTLLELSGWEADMTADLRTFSRSDRMSQWAAKLLDSIEAGSTREFRDGKNQLIAKIHRFIEDHLAHDVSLQTIADHIGLHPVYLSALYKQEMNENISDYIMRYRMDKARVLLGTTDIKIYELASELGFQNPPYFSKLFKQYYGVTPQEYRARLTP